MEKITTGRRAPFGANPEVGDAGRATQQRILGAATDAESLHRELRSLDVDFFMVRRPWPSVLPVRSTSFERFFEKVDLRSESEVPRTFDLYRLRASAADASQR